MAKPAPGEQFRSHWLAFPVAHLLADGAPQEPPITIEVRTADQPMIIETAEGGVRARPGSAANPDATITGPPGPILGLLTRRLDLAEAKKRGLKFEGKTAVLKRIQPAFQS